MVATGASPVSGLCLKNGTINKRRGTIVGFEHKYCRRRTRLLQLNGYPPWTLVVAVLLFCVYPCHGQTTKTIAIDEGITGPVKIGSLENSPGRVVKISEDTAFASDFSLNEETGDISVKSNVVIDRERTSEYKVTAYSSETFVVTTVTITVNDINDNSPYFSQPYIEKTLPEDAPDDTIISLGTATDNDAGNNGVQKFEIFSGNVGGIWRLHSKATGGRLYAELKLNNQLDYEDPSLRHFHLVIRAFDGGNPQRFGDLIVNITVLDQNDNTPLFSHSLYSAEVYDNATVGQSIMQVSATDQDEGENARIIYSIEPNLNDNAADKFSIDSRGVITVNSVLEYDPAKPTIQLTVKAANPASRGEQSSSCVVRITLLHVTNRRKPNIHLLWLTEGGAPKVPESAQPGEYVARVSVSDPDANQDLSLSIVNVTLSGGDGHFGLTKSGDYIYIIVVKVPPDRETQPVFTLTITATDSGTPPLIATQVVNIEVGDTNDNAPVFSQPLYRGFIQEIVSPGASVLQVTATDRDAGNNSLISYSIVPTPITYSHWFQIDEHTGLITTAAKIDCETASQPQLIVKATDNGRPPLSATASVLVDIRDVNDNQPVFDQSFYNISVPENKPINSCFLRVSATDPDCGVNAQVTYSIASNLGFEYPREFYIKNHTGDICVLHSLDFETKDEYEFIVVAKDLDGLDTTASVKVRIVDINDNRPVFYPSRYSVNLHEDTSPGATVAILFATDADQGVNKRIIYSIVSGNAGGFFTIDANNGHLYLLRTLPYNVPLHVLQVQAADGGGLASLQNAEVRVSVIKSNQQAPEFDLSLYKFSVAENVTTGKSVGTVRATSTDSGAGSITYSIVAGDPSSYFSINPSTGVVTTRTVLDHERHSSLLLNLQAAIGNPPLYGRTQLNITITDVNDNPPHFNIRNIAINIREDTDTNTVIYQAHAVDPDSGANGRVRYTLLTNPAGRFTINAVSGAIRLTQAVDYEQRKNYTVVVGAQDGGTPSESSQMVVIFNIQDVNDNAPVFTANKYTFTISEAVGPSTKIGQVKATDRDSGNNARITYNLVRSSQAPLSFGIFTNDGYIYNTQTLNREVKDKYVFQVMASDNGSPIKNSLVTVEVIVEDVNDVSPDFTRSVYQFSLLENEPVGTVIGMVSAVDGDLGDNSKLTYELVSTSSSFAVEPNSGQIKTKIRFDRESGVMEYVFTVKVKDHGSEPLSDTADVKVTILDRNDNPPQFQPSSAYNAGVEENKAKGTSVIRVSAVDPDVGRNGTVRYSLKSGVGDNRNFQINPLSGWITTTEVLDRETKGSYTLIVIARDNGIPSQLSSQATVQVTVRDVNEPPTFPTAFISFSVKENTPPGTIVGRVQANDNDQGANAEIKYYLVSGNLFGTFGLNMTTGDVYIARPVDYEMSSGYQMRVHAVDSSAINQQSTYVNVNITVIDMNDNQPKFTQDPVVLSVNEGLSSGSEVFTYTATDADSGWNSLLKYTIVSQSPDGQPYFVLDSTSGKLTVGPRDIDAEVDSEILLIVQAEDQAVKVSDRRVTRLTTIITVVDLNDNAPSFQSRNVISVMEDEPVGYPATHVIARDNDKGENGRVTFTILSGNAEQKFHLDTTSGLLTLKAMLDREEKAQYQLVIMATDHGSTPKSSTQTLTINVIDLNDNAPHFEKAVYKVNVTENQPQIPVTTVVATDTDSGDNSNLTYFFAEGTAGGKFEIDAKTGEITTTEVLDREQRDTYILTVYVRDNGFPTQYDSATVIVDVLDVNDHTPVFVSSVYALVVPENNAAVTVIHSVVATDADSGVNGNITYSIIAGNIGNKFSINPRTGELSVGALDREAQARYNLTIRARDQGASPLSSTCLVTVTVEDINDNDPVFTKDVYAKSIYEDEPIGATVMTIQATDADEAGNNSKISYSLNNRTQGMFKINNSTGVITTTGLLNREKVASYQFEVRASDAGLYDPRKSVKQVTITILDVNDNAPYFTQIPFNANVSIGTRTGTEISQLIAEDKDEGVNSQIVYRFKQPDGKQEKYYSIESLQNKGHVKVKRSLDINAGNIHTMTVKACDNGINKQGGSDSLCSEGLLVVRIGDNPSISTLRFDKFTYAAYISEAATVDTEVTTVRASYVQPSPGQTSIKYSFANSNDDEIFRINEDNGVITIKDQTKLDYETTQRLRLIVLAASTTAHGYTTVWVNLNDYNDNAPKFAENRYTSSVYEGNNRGTYVTQVSASDADSGDNGQIRYNIVSGNRNDAFTIFPAHSGIVTTNKRLDREIQDSYRLEIEAVDMGDPPRSSTCTLRITVVDINDNEPFIPDLVPVSLPEGTDVGTVITTVTATDADTNPTLTYSFAPNGNPDNTFSIDRFSGKLSLAKSVDHEKKSLYVLMITASDTVHDTTANLTVNILDVNDNAPVFRDTTYMVDVPELSPPGYSVITVTASDADSGRNSDITYSIVSVQGSEAFHINPSTGTIYTNKTVIYSPNQQVISLVITATDNGRTPLSSLVSVRIRITDINNYSPRFLGSPYSAYVNEHTATGRTILQVSAEDKDDSTDNKRVNYEIQSGNEENKFEIIPSTGEIILVGDLDRETKSLYTLSVKASDHGTPPMASTATVFIYVNDINDWAPEFNQSVYSVSVDESIPPGTSIVQVYATDKDVVSQEIEYAITSGNEDGMFVVNEQTGLISVSSTKQVDHDTKSIYKLVVRARDSAIQGQDRLSAYATVIVNITDINDHEPMFPVLMYLESVREDAKVGTSVFTAHANDGDKGIYGTVEYQITENNEYFLIDKNTGVVTTHAEFDYENTNVYEFKILATDLGARQDLIKVSIAIIGVDEFSPVFAKDSYSFDVRGDAEKGHVVGSVQATDKDGGPDGIVVYSIQADQTGSHRYFQVDPKSGVISVAYSLRQEILRKRRSVVKRALPPDFSLIVKASSGKKDSKSSTIVCRIAVDFTCAGCQPIGRQDTTTVGAGPSKPYVFEGTPLILVVVFAVVAVILVSVIVIILLRNRWKRKRTNDPPQAQFDEDFDTVNVPSQTTDEAPPRYNDIRREYSPRHHNRSELSDQSHSASSGRGSSEFIPEDDDEELRIINSAPLVQTNNLIRKAMPDSGIQHDHDNISDTGSVQNHQEYLARLGIDASKIKTDCKPKGLARSVESMHHFSDEGGGEGDGLDIGVLVEQKLGEVEADEDMAIMDGTREFGFGETEPSHAGSLSSVINSEEEFSGSYNWDYLLDWGPQYQPLAHVFSEIARLKDETIQPKKQPIRTVPQVHIPNSLKPQLKTRPPPIITNVPPKANPIAAGISGGSSSNLSSGSGGAMNSNRTSQLTSVSLPKSPISYESSFTSPALSPSFTPTLSPLATRSPSISPLQTPGASQSGRTSGQSTPRSKKSRSQRNLAMIHSSGSEQELRI